LRWRNAYAADELPGDLGRARIGSASGKRATRCPGDNRLHHASQVGFERAELAIVGVIACSIECRCLGCDGSDTAATS
jgi:hypothetical protein